MGRLRTVGRSSGDGCDRCHGPLEGEVVALREEEAGEAAEGRLCHDCYARLLARRELEPIRVEKTGPRREVVVLELPELSATRNG